MSADTRIQFRNILTVLMNKEGLSDKDMEQVENNLEYSRGIRTLSVLDPMFDWQIDSSVDMFKEKRKEDSTLRKETFVTLYGEMHVALKNDDQTISVSMME